MGSWFHAADFRNPVKTRDALKAYDPSLALLIAEIFGDGDWRYTSTATRMYLPHLQGFNPQDAFRFDGLPLWEIRGLELEEQLRDPNSDGDGKWVNLELYHPSLLPSLIESTTRGDGTSFIFVNLTGNEISFYFVDADGTEHFHYRAVVETRDIGTYAGAIWLIKDHNGEDLAVFRAEEKIGRVLISAAPGLITPGLSKISGDNQTSVSGAVLANPFVIEVRDENLSVLEGISVTFTVTIGDGTLGVTHTMTDENGRAESTYTLGPNPGANTVSVSAAGIEQPVTFNAIAEAVVDLPDPNLRAAIETTFGKAEGDSITPLEMATLTRLDARNANISDLTGLEGATNLIELFLGAEWVDAEGDWINSNSVSNLSPLAGLINLARLELRGNDISDISPLAGLAKLTQLSIEDNSVSDILPLSGLTNLTELELFGNNISDLSALAGLTNLTWLQLFGNNLSDLSALAGLTNLTRLSLARNNLSDISPLAGLTNLTRLSLARNNLSDISPLAGLTNLATLGLANNNLSDLSPLAGLTNLARLGLRDNSISDISPLAGLTNLARADLKHNNISDISPLVANTGLSSGDEVLLNDNPLSYSAINTHIPTLQSRGITVEFDNRTPTPPLKISGDNQQGVPGAALERPFVVEVRDGTGAPFEGVPVTFTITAGGGVVHPENVLTDENGRAESTLTLGFSASTNTVHVNVEGISEPVIFNAVGEIEFDLSMPASISLIHIPLKVTTVDGVAKTITSIADLHDALGGADTINFLIAYDYATQGWLSYFGSSDTGTSADKVLTDDIGIIAGMIVPVSIRLGGSPLGANGTSTITLNQGINLVGLPLRDSRVTRVSDLFALDGIGGNVPVIILTDNGEFKAVGRAGDVSDILLTGGQSFILTAQKVATVAISGEGWTNVLGTSAAPPVTMTGIEVTDTTPVLALRGSIVDEEASLQMKGFRVTVKNLSTDRKATAVTAPDGAGYRLTVVDIETGRAAQIGDSLEISAQSPDPFIGVQPLQYTVTAEDVRQSRIQLPELVVYEIPAETELLANYPNPFNPETWIPYRLAEDAFVTLTIYDLSGQVIRTLEVGHRIASTYENRSKAIYWDGRNGLGERVASGVYFYTLTAGDFSITRRMVILK